MEALQFIGTLITDFLGGAMVLRLLLQFWRADFYNPLAQTIVKVTDPFLRPLRVILPQVQVAPGRKLDVASIAGIFLLHLAVYGAFAALKDMPFPFYAIVIAALLHTFKLFIAVYLFTLIVQAILSWLGPQVHNHPASPLLHAINEPLLRPVRQMLPDTGGIDFSTMVVTILLYLIWIMIP